MNPEFWHERWYKNEIAFHQHQANPLLVAYFDQLKLAKGSRIFVPLCGKTLDIYWLLTQGVEVVGAELSELAVTQLFAALDIEPKITQMGSIQLYSADSIAIYQGDIFKLSKKSIGSIDGIYDRAALVALPYAMRQAYTQHLITITQAAPQLLLTFEYDQAQMNGPPFSVAAQEVSQHYAQSYKLVLLATNNVVGGLKKHCDAKENLWLLTYRSLEK